MLEKDMFFIIDFDSTFIKVEAFDELCLLCYSDNVKRKNIPEQVKAITNLGMEGKISITESLEKRLKLLNAHASHLPKLITILKSKVSDSFINNRAFFETYRESIYIVSNGFKEFIEPVVLDYGIKQEHVFANTFEYDVSGHIIGFDKKNCLSGEKGKVKLVETLKLEGTVVVIGDGYTDYQIKEAGLAHVFYAYTENIVRDAVVSKTPFVAERLDDIIFGVKNTNEYSLFLKAE